MNSESRFILAIVLMLAVLVGTNLLFPPPPPEPQTDAETAEEVVDTAPELGEQPEPVEPAAPRDPELPPLVTEEPVPEIDEEEALVEERVVVEGPLWRFTFSNLGARATSTELLEFESFAHDGAVQLVASESAGYLGNRVVVGADTIDLRAVPFTVSPAEGLRFEEGDAPAPLTFVYEHPSAPFSFEVRYTFDPSQYVVGVEGRVRGLERGLLVTELGRGLAFNEVDAGVEARSMAYAMNHLQRGVRSEDISGVDRALVEEGPMHWGALRSQYFVIAAIPSLEPMGAEFFGGLLVRPLAEENGQAAVAITQSLGSDGLFGYRLVAAPQDYSLLSSLGYDLQEVNPVGWRWLRPIIRPVVGLIMWVLVGLHEALDLGYGWVLILFGVMMRVLLFPLNHKAMKAQLRNLAVQPLLKDIQTKYKDEPEKLQKEMMRLYKEHGFNPLAGCWPMLLPWPVLIALFFVFQNTIELRGVPFWWLPDLSAKDPFFILPVLLGLSMFLMQWVTMRTIEEPNPQMKMMMYLLPVFMAVVFAQFPAGLNLYYLTANLATLPQSWWIANERKKVQAKGPPEPVKA